MTANRDHATALSDLRGPATSPAGWPVAAGVLALALAALLLIFRETAASAVAVWLGSATFNHCFLVPPISAWLVWRRRSELALCPPRPSLWGVPVLAVFGLAWLVGRLASVNEVQHFALVGMMQGLFLLVLGGLVYRRLLFPFLYLFFMVPTGEFLVPDLQAFTAAFIVSGLELLGIPVYSDGILIAIPNGLFEVAEACAGLRFLIASVAFGALFAHLVYRRWLKRAAFMALSVAVPVLANGIRALGIVLIAHWTDNQVAVGVDHIVYGWGFFAAVLLLLIWLGLRFEDDEAALPRRHAGSDARPAGPALLIAAGGAALLLAALPRAWADHVAAAPSAADPAALSAPALAEWRLVDRPPDGWRPQFPGADGEVVASYAGPDGGVVHLYVAFYGRQDGERKVVGSGNRLADGETWTRLGVGSMPAVMDGKDLEVRTERITDLKVARQVWYWYWVDGRFVGDPLAAKLLQLKAELLGGRRSAALVAVAADDGGPAAGAEDRLRRFLAALGPLGPMLAAAGG